MSNCDLYIIAAGKGSRINDSVPKALIAIDGDPCLTTTLVHAARKFRRVFVVTNVLVLARWQAYFEALEASHPELWRRTLNVPIHSGLGDGHATLQGMLAAERMEAGSLSQEVVIAWGDVFLPTADLVNELLSAQLEGAGLLPAIEESDPYVTLLVDKDNRCIAADFSKYGERHARGLHDQSVFRFRRAALKGALASLHAALWKGNRYITANGEFSLLYSFHQLYNLGNPVQVYETRHRAFGFNTPEDVAEIRRRLGTQLAQTLDRTAVASAGRPAGHDAATVKS